MPHDRLDAALNSELEGLRESGTDKGAEAVITMCPMCHMNLDGRQADMNINFDMPVFYSTQLTTLAFGLDVEKSYFNKNLVDPMPLLQSKKFFWPNRKPVYPENGFVN